MPCTTLLDVVAESYNNGTCFICEKVVGRSVHLDHDHKTGEFRGFLCHHCNGLLGFAGDDPELLLRAIDYLEL